MAGQSLVVVRLRSNTGIPADTVEMQFAFDNDSHTGGSGGSADAAVLQFLNATYAGVGSLSSFLAGSLNHSSDAMELDTYDLAGHLDGSPHGSPVRSITGTLDTPSVDTDLPLQASIGLSYHGDLSGIPEFGPSSSSIPTPEQAQDYGAPATHTGTTRLKARHRGRIFFGPLNEAAMKSTVLRIREPDDSFVAVANAAMADLAASGVDWSVWSRRNAAMVQVTGGWVALETDVVRRRRLKATTRTLWP